MRISLLLLGDNMNAFHQRAELLYREAIVSVSSPGEYFGSAEYENLRRQAAAAFASLEVPLEVFFDVIAGRADGSRLAHPGIGAALSFPSRFLRETSLKALPRPVQEALDNLMHQNFFFGLVSHFLLNTFPTRSEVEKVDIASLLKEWFPSSLIANELMREYSKAANDLPLRIFEWYFERDAKPVLQGAAPFWVLASGESKVISQKSILCWRPARYAV